MPGVNILIVEDERIIARELQTDLEEMGYAVTGIVNSGEKAIQHALEKKPDLVLMDIRLRTEMDGIEAASQIFTRFKIPVIFISAFTDDTLIQRAKNVGSFGYLVKPYEKRELYACIEMAVYKARMEKKLEETEKYSRAIFEQSPLSIQVFDKNGLTINVNRAWSELWQQSPDEVIGKYNILEGEARKTELSDFITAVLDGESDFSPVFEYESGIKGEDGNQRFLKCVIFPVKDVDHKVHKAVLMHEDITAQKQAEKDRLNLERQTQRAQKMETVATLAGGIAHQFNNALFVITGNIELMEEDNPFDDNTAEKLRIIKDSADRMAHLTRQLLAYSGGGKYRTQIMSLSTLLKEAMPLVKYSLDSTVSADTDNCVKLHLEVYPTQIQLALSAVLTNASEAMRRGEKGHIRVDCRKFTLTEKDAGDFPNLRLGDYACLTITDDGRGMDEKTRVRVFEPFFTTKFQGRGLGMAAVHGIINNHDGQITVASESGQGTTVKIYLPTVAPPAPKQAPPSLESLKGRGTILVIEDEEIVMAVNRVMLENLGYRVLEANTGLEAIDIVKTFDGRIDLVLLDFLLPDINGDEVYPLLMEARPDLKVLVISGFAIDGPVKKILEAGAQGFIQKPSSKAKLAERLKRILKNE
ncbi:response regulator [Desulfococcaceae bacterium HSG9]|nr:response regulator [Desulfococcaceae bacterium HSG9]